MSFSDAVGQVDQIRQWEQQLGSGALLSGAAASGTSSSSTAGTASATGGTTATDPSTTSTTAGSSTAATFADALAQIQNSEASSLLTSADNTGGAADSATAGLDPTSLSSSSLLSGGDSQLLAVLSALESAAATPSSQTSTTALASATATNPTTATSPSDPRIQAMVQEANSLVGQPYVWGGGHSGWGPQTGYDCSGFVSAVLHAGGYLSSPQDTTSLPDAAGIASGPGQYVTIYDRDAPGQEGHVIIDIAGQFYESGGERGSWGGGGGVEKIATPTAAYLATFNQILHPEGL